jgi:hypothetical protein
MKKLIIFIVVAGVYILLALGASWANNAGAVDKVVDDLGFQSETKVVSSVNGVEKDILEGINPSNMPIPHPPSPPPTR